MMKKSTALLASLSLSLVLAACGDAGSSSDNKADVSVPNNCGQNSWCSMGFNDGLSEIKSRISGGGTVGSVDEVHQICTQLRSSLASGPVEIDDIGDYSLGCWDAVQGYLWESGTW